MVFNMHPCGLHVYYPEKTDGKYSFVQTVADNMKLFTKRQIEGALKARIFTRLLPILQMLTLRCCFKLAALAVAPSQLLMPRLLIRFGEPLSLSSKGVLYERLVSVNLRVW
jgi:hypothetical protein